MFLVSELQIQRQYEHDNTRATPPDSERNHAIARAAEIAAGEVKRPSLNGFLEAARVASSQPVGNLNRAAESKVQLILPLVAPSSPTAAP